MDSLDEAWMHAACLTIAETGQKWGENVHPSPAMEAVYNLRQECDRLRGIVDADGKEMDRLRAIADNPHQTLSQSELTERFYQVREQRDKLTTAMQKIGRWCDGEEQPGQCVYEIETIVRDVFQGLLPIPKKVSTVAKEIAARVWCDQEMRNCTMDVDAAERIARIVDEVRREQCDELGYQGLIASGGIVDAP